MNKTDLEIDQESKRTKRNLLPILILWIGIAMHLWFGRIGEVKVTLALIGLIIGSLVSYKYWNKGVVIVGILYLLSIFNILSFYPISFRIGIELEEIFVGIDIVMLGLSLIYFRANKILSG